MIDEFIEYLDAQVGRSLYVWGAQGQTEITEKWIRSRETSEANVQRVVAFWKELQAKGISPIAAYDCSGLIMHYLQDMTGFYKNDLSAAGLYRNCAPVRRSALEKGDLVFRDNGSKVHHVGVYLGDGTAIEAQGRDAGVTRRTLDAGGKGYWNRYGRLPLPDAFPFLLRDIGKQLQDNIRDEGAGQIPSIAGIEQRHIQYHHRDPFLFGQQPPLLQNFLIVPAQTVDRLDREDIPRPQGAEQPFVGGPVEILAALFVQINAFVRHAKLMQGDDLPCFVLLPGGYPDIPVEL